MLWCYDTVVLSHVAQKAYLILFDTTVVQYIPILKEIWEERCVDRNTPVIGGRIVAE